MRRPTLAAHRRAIGTGTMPSTSNADGCTRAGAERGTGRRRVERGVRVKVDVLSTPPPIRIPRRRESIYGHHPGVFFPPILTYET
jgi:hypothetical protein